MESPDGKVQRDGGGRGVARERYSNIGHPGLKLAAACKGIRLERSGVAQAPAAASTRRIEEVGLWAEVRF